MAAEFTYNPIQEVQPNQAALLNTSIGCTKGYVVHRNESGLVILRGIVNNPCSTFARYQITAVGNMAIPAGGTVGEISVALAIAGEPIQTSRARVTPAAVDEYFNFTSTALVTVPKGCCFTVTLEDVADQAINLQNLNVVVARLA